MSRLQGLQEGEFIGINCWPLLKGMKPISNEKEKDLILNCLKDPDNIGKGHIVQTGNRQYVAVLMDIDFQTDPNNKRYIFTFFNSETNMDETVDTLYDTRTWKVFDLDVVTI